MTDSSDVIFYLILIFTGSISSYDQALARSCQVYPTEYAYHTDSVTRSESVGANCRKYSSGPTYPMNYIHCDGSNGRLTDSNPVPEQFSSSNYYVWSVDTSNQQLLFIFLTRVTFNSITIHYYGDTVTGLPRLRFFAVPNDFDIWDAPTASYSYTDISAVPPDGEPPKLRHISHMANLSARKVLMYKFGSNFRFAVSEVEFFSCEMTKSNWTNTININATLSPPTATDINVSATTAELTTKVDHRDSITITAEDGTRNSHVGDSTTNFVKLSLNTMTSVTKSWVSAGFPLPPTISGLVLAILLLLLATILGTVLVLFLYKRKYWQQNSNIEEGSYLTICRGDAQQLQPELLHTPVDFYDEIQLSPLTGQAELISNTESQSINCNSQHQHGNSHNVDTEQPVDLDKDTAFEQPTYAIPNKKQNRKNHIPKRGTELTYCRQTNIFEKERDESSNGTDQNSVKQRQALEELYTSVKKTPKGRTADNEEEVPPLPPHTVEELYTEVQKKPNDSTSQDEAEAPPIPPHTIEELYTAVRKNET